jgi:hypothetical protein
MKKFEIAVCLMIASACLFPVAGQSTSNAGAAPATTQSTRPSVRPVTIPQDAVANPDGSYTWTDKDGSKWFFRRTPFGVSKSPAAGQSQLWQHKSSQPAQTQPVTKAVESGDIVHFERTNPFGVTRWDKKKSDLNDEERKILAEQSTKTDQTKTSTGSASKPKSE